MERIPAPPLAIIQVGIKLFLKESALISDDDGTIEVFGYAEMGEHKGMSSEQCTGTASSYARKYALNGLFLIDETESDPDSKDNTKTEPKKFTERLEEEKIKQKPFIYFKYYESLLKIGRIGLTFGTGRKRVRYGILQR